MNVYNEFHRPFYEILFKEIKPVERFYDRITCLYFMTVGIDNISSNSFFDLKDFNKIEIGNLNGHNQEVMGKARSIMLHISFQDVKSGYNIKNVPLFIHNLGVVFEDNYYTFNGKAYPYSEYPSMKDITDTLDSVKRKCLATLEKAKNG